MRDEGVSLMITCEHSLEQIRPFYDSAHDKETSSLRKRLKSPLNSVQTLLDAKGKSKRCEA